MKVQPFEHILVTGKDMGKNYIDLDSSTLYRCNQKYYDKVLGEYNLGYSQFIFLSSIFENEGMMMNELATNGSFDKGSITKAISKLEELGFVRIENSEDDKRTKKLFTTQKTKDLMPKLYLIRQEWVNYLAEDLSQEDIENYSKVMDKLLLKAKEYSKTDLTNDDVKFYGLQKLTLLDYPGKMAATIFTGGCNFRCPFCHNKGLVYLNDGQEEISEEEILNYLESRKNILDGVCITGGEPLLQEGIEDFLRKVRKIGINIKLDTNGTYFEKLKRIIEEGLVDYVAMDIKNSKELYATTTGLEKVSIDSIEKSVAYLKEGHVDYEFRTTLVKEFHKDTDFKKVGEWLKGAKHYYLQSFVDHGTCIQEGLSALDVSEIKKIKETVAPYVNEIEIRGIEEGE